MLITLLLVGLLGWCFFSYWRMHRLWRWWESRRLEYLHQQAEQVRNGLLQDLFALRRGIELLLTEHRLSDCEAGQQLLRQIEGLFQPLEKLSDDLSSPFGGENFPLALKQVLAEQVEPSPGSSLEVNFPTQWSAIPNLHHQFVLIFVKMLINRGVYDEELITRVSIKASLEHHADRCTLILHTQYDRELDSAYTSDSLRLCQVFKLFSWGDCSCRTDSQSETWTVSWS